MSKQSPQVLLIAGSPSASSRSASLQERLATLLRAQGVTSRVVYATTDFPASELLQGSIDAPSVREFREQVSKAKVVVFATPIYRATYSGVLKLLVDFIPPEALENKTVLGLATGRSEEHFPLIADAFEGLFSAFRGTRPLPTVVISDYQFASDGSLERTAEAAFHKAFQAVVRAATAIGGPAPAPSRGRANAAPLQRIRSKGRAGAKAAAPAGSHGRPRV